MLLLRAGVGGLATNEEIHVVELDFPLGHHARTLLRIGPEFIEPVNDDMITNKER